MSHPMNPVAPGQARPTTVTISSWLLFLVAALQVAGTIVALSALGTIADIYNDAYEGTELEGSGDFLAGIGIIGGSAFGVLMAVGLVVLAIFNNRGKNGSRITTWVLGGLLLCCSGFGLVGQLAGASMNFGTGGGDLPDPEEIQRRIDEAVPWYTPTAAGLGLVALLALATALILLALPPSNEYFRKRQPVWEPPVPGYPGYQAQPGYPPAGSHAPAPFQPAQPPPGSPPDQWQPPGPPSAQPPPGSSPQPPPGPPQG
ncbi:MAG TPA: hypothetical protein VFR67_12015 [Pilimelia sp.]|nr:hypothetical protein [Pilimelia sp.]